MGFKEYYCLLNKQRKSTQRASFFNCVIIERECDAYTCRRQKYVPFCRNCAAYYLRKHPANMITPLVMVHMLHVPTKSENWLFNAKKCLHLRLLSSLHSFLLTYACVTNIFGFQLRFIFNKADTLPSKALLRIYGSLMWGLGE